MNNNKELIEEMQFQRMAQLIEDKKNEFQNGGSKEKVKKEIDAMLAQDPASDFEVIKLPGSASSYLGNLEETQANDH